MNTRTTFRTNIIFCIMTSQNCVVVSRHIYVANYDDYCPTHTSQPCCMFQCSPVPTHLVLSCRPTSRPTITRADDKRPLHSAEGESRAPACMVLIAKRAYSLFPMAKYLVDYQAPAWAQKLKNVPKHKVELAMENTPIHEWNLPGIPDGFSLHIKRHDMTGSSLSGNKVGKLEFLLADAISKGCKHVITCGGAPSNHCRALALACRQLGLIPHLFLTSGAKTSDDVGCRGNILLDRLSGADIYMMPLDSDDERDVHPKMESLAKKIMDDTGEKSYLIPKGGSNLMGVFGTMAIFDELSRQGALERFDDLFLTCGSGGTTTGLCIANHLAGSPLRIHGVMVHSTPADAHRHVNGTLRELGVEDARSEDIVDVIDTYQGKGYSISKQEELDFIVEVSSTTGVLVDPTYTGKAAWGLVQEMKNNPGRFKGRRVLFLHTGGMFGLFDGRMDDMLMQHGALTNNVRMCSKQTNGAQNGSH
ncbi:bifunctional D-cysteine desulfhydrase/1-aminocyclopropane-1-carboxylate deaminase, mitochondrial-like [Haliotis rufescens]|uniref:bifunctional D-cysteine desulfhydrase/1-aminocyclopropane-1-carboxylate deaminase, mitochondrial-like n=1 Tax=Haliotis rufescens TaxID=6454 RepID=UPI001EAFA43C|nr:bifunctional D-cysteine desulfhydrase/1-aminocyclopropane-1-carboxylate deaminase, mitochondrial-like [Haliotis rufescens]